MLSAVADARGPRVLVYPQPTTLDTAHHTHTLPHAHVRRAAHPSSARRDHTCAGPRHADGAHPETYPTDPAASHAHVPSAHAACRRHRAHRSDARATHPAPPTHAKSPHAHAHHRVEAAHHAHVPTHHGAIKVVPIPLIMGWYIIDMSPAPALFIDMNGILLPIGAALPAVAWPLLKLLFGVVAARPNRC